MTHSKLHQLCKREKERAMRRAESADPAVRYDSAQAINAWDELLGQMYKPKAIKPRRFEKTKDTALRIVACCSDSHYKARLTQKIQNLQLNT